MKADAEFVANSPQSKSPYWAFRSIGISYNAEKIIGIINTIIIPTIVTDITLTKFFCKKTPPIRFVIIPNYNTNIFF